MKRNFDLPMTDFDGKPYGDGATLRTVAFMAIQAVLPTDDRMVVGQKLALYNLAAKVAKGGVVDLSVEDLALLKERIGNAMTPMAVGKAFELLEQDFVEQDFVKAA